MLKRRTTILTTAAAAAIGLLATGCQPATNTVTINYTKVGVCGSYEPNPGASPEEVQFANPTFVVYTITSIDNTASGAKDFPFDPNLLYSVGGGSLAGAPFSEIFTANAQTVNAGSTANNPGWLALDVPDDVKDAQNAQVNLFYHTPAGQSVLLNETDNGTAIINGGICTPASVP